MSDEEEKLVGLVSKYELLFDMSNKNYSNTEIKDNIWKQIGEQMNWPASKCKDKWKKLRDNFRKAIKARKTKSGDAAKKIRPWKLEQQMAFLLPHITERPQTSNIQTTEEETGNSSEEDSYSNISSPPPTPSTTSTSSAPKKKIQKCRQMPPNNVADVLQNYLSTKDISKKKVENNNSIRSFFLSMSEATENLPAHLQIEVKSKVFKAVNEAELAALSERQHVQSNRAEYPPYQLSSLSGTSRQHSNNFQDSVLLAIPQTSPDINHQYYSYTQPSSSSCQQTQAPQFSEDLTNLHNLDDSH
ncbi:uncharacterized protein LOC126748344 [Anthonomus grandis grandis]|uniref:uncharacterized protein LOC126748344 n=1 Tax=Anthonomus grandis grandis TaxID=2921223 RepID=UPI002165FE5F|nr:uncharacterized protein LOC126748344 [Anthonomus grandis grandis]